MYPFCNCFSTAINCLTGSVLDKILSQVFCFSESQLLRVQGALEKSVIRMIDECIKIKAACLCSEDTLTYTGLHTSVAWPRAQMAPLAPWYLKNNYGGSFTPILFCPSFISCCASFFPFSSFVVLLPPLYLPAVFCCF